MHASLLSGIPSLSIQYILTLQTPFCWCYKHNKYNSMMYLTFFFCKKTARHIHRFKFQESFRHHGTINKKHDASPIIYLKKVTLYWEKVRESKCLPHKRSKTGLLCKGSCFLAAENSSPFRSGSKGGWSLRVKISKDPSSKVTHPPGKYLHDSCKILHGF